MKLKFICFLFLLITLAPFCVSYSLSDLPKPFIEDDKENGIFIAGNNTDDLISLSLMIIELREQYHPALRSGNSIRDRSLFSPNSRWSHDNRVDIQQNIISIGGPCSNKVTAEIMGVPNNWPECAMEFFNVSSRIIMYNKWNRTQLIIAGFTANDTFSAVYGVALGNNLLGFEVRNGELFLSREERYCNNDQDCIVSSTGCCRPSYISVNKQFIGNYQRDCSKIACAQSFIVEEELSLAKCIDNQCTII